MKFKNIKKNLINILLTILGYILFYIFKYFVPLKISSQIGYYLGYYVLAKIKLTKKPIFLNNISYVFPDKTKEEIFNIYRLSCANFLQNLFEIAKINKLTKYITLNDPYNLYEYICNSKNPVLLFSGHFGNWELIAIKFKHLPGYGIYKPPTNKFINKLFLKMRLQDQKDCKFKMLSLNKNQILNLINEAKKNKLRLAMLIDQKVKEGILANFLGKPAYTIQLLPILAIKYKIPLIPIKVTRDFNSKKFKFIFNIEKPLNLDTLNYNPQDILKATEMMNDTIGKWIKEHPEQWFWLYNRW